MNLHLVRNPVSFDSRVLKETACVAKSGVFDQVEICGFHEPGYQLNESIGLCSIFRVKLTTRALPKNLIGQIIKYIEWHIRILKRYRHCLIKIIHCHDLAPLFIAVTLKSWYGGKLIYDAHELETETMGMRGLRQRLARWLESRLMSRVDALITVSPAILSWYQEQYPRVPAYLVRNIPVLSVDACKALPLRSKFAVSDNSLLFMYLGGLGRGRGIEYALAAFAKPEVSHHVVFMGAGPLQDVVKKYEANFTNIHYLPPVLPSEVLAYVRNADAGLCLIEDLCLNYRYCLPNKLFEVILAGLPVLASDLPEQSAIVKNYQAGWLVNMSVDAIADKLASLTVADCHAVQRGLKDRARGLSWANESAVLLRVYQELLA